MYRNFTLTFLTITGFVFMFSQCGKQKEPEKKGGPPAQISEQKQPHPPKKPEPVPASILFKDSLISLSPGDIHIIAYKIAPDSFAGRLPLISSDTSTVQILGDSITAKSVGKAIVSIGELRGYILNDDSLIVVVKENPSNLKTKKKSVSKKTVKRKGTEKKQKTVALKKFAKIPSAKKALSRVKEKSCELRIISKPAFAQIRVDGKEWGETPMTDYKKISAGSHYIELKHRNYPVKDTTIFIKPGEWIRLKMNLEE